MNDNSTVYEELSQFSYRTHASRIRQMHQIHQAGRDGNWTRSNSGEKRRFIKQPDSPRHQESLRILYCLHFTEATIRPEKRITMVFGYI